MKEVEYLDEYAEKLAGRTMDERGRVIERKKRYFSARILVVLHRFLLFFFVVAFDETTKV